MNDEEVDCVGSGLVVGGFVVVVVVVVFVVVDFGVVVGRENCHLPTLSGLIASGLKEFISELKIMMISLTLRKLLLEKKRFRRFTL